MKAVVNLADYKAEKFSQADENASKMSAQSDCAKILKTPENTGFGTVAAPPSEGQLGSKSKPSKTKGILSTHVPPVSVHKTTGPEGYKIDCDQLNATQLRLAYPSEYVSWRDRKSRCKKKSWPWAAEWEEFKDFLRGMGPKPSPQHTLDRIDNSLGAYGPGLCRWASKVEQNNNKSDNIKIVLPLVGVEFSAKKLAHLHKVTVKTIYKWKANDYSDLEMIAGKKSLPMAALSEALSKLPAAKPPKFKKPQIKVPDYVPPNFPDTLEPTADEIAEYEDTGVMNCASSHELHRMEYDALVTWIKGYNAGLPVSQQPPQGRYLKPKRPPNAPLPPVAAMQIASSKPAKSFYEDVPDAHFDLTDCADPEDDPDYDPADCVDPDE